MFYEITPWRTVGGQSGFYELESAWDTPFELILDSISANVATTVVIGFDANDDLASIIAGYATSTIKTPGWRGAVLRIGANAPASFPFSPIPVENRRVYIQILTDSSGACYVTAHMRRQGPEDGAYDHSRSNLEATIGMGTSTQATKETGEQWASNLATDNSSALAQSAHRPNSPIRRHNAWRKAPARGLGRLSGK